ncbi:hypothetical protein pEaSNUABM29_00223 [Erwinia phage pEa_SNUABM_29]|nr:hypothetical protein pEaSNUABM29_00223 [Erwinia phage pEa_SNUABM_29]
MDLQDWFKRVEIKGNRGWVYTVVADALILLSLKVLESVYSSGTITKETLNDILAHLTMKHRVLGQPDTREEVLNVLADLLEQRRELVYKMGREILNTAEHGGNLDYNIIDLVACQYWFKEENLLASNL